MSFKFSKVSSDPDIRRMQKEIQDNFGTQSEIKDKMKLVKNFQKTPPTSKTLSKGEKKYYDDGTDKWRYENIDGKIFKTQLTEVT